MGITKEQMAEKQRQSKLEFKELILRIEEGKKKVSAASSLDKVEAACFDLLELIKEAQTKKMWIESRESLFKV
ncbi:hypothetical protein D3C71_2069190 [compost metagenome]